MKRNNGRTKNLRHSGADLVKSHFPCGDLIRAKNTSRVMEKRRMITCVLVYAKEGADYGKKKCC